MRGRFGHNAFSQRLQLLFATTTCEHGPSSWLSLRWSFVHRSGADVEIRDVPPQRHGAGANGGLKGSGKNYGHKIMLGYKTQRDRQMPMQKSAGKIV